MTNASAFHMSSVVVLFIYKKCTCIGVCVRVCECVKCGMYSHVTAGYLFALNAASSSAAVDAAYACKGNKFITHPMDAFAF